MRITEKDLEVSIKRLNQLLKRPETPYSYEDLVNKRGLKSNPGNLHLDVAYGGWQLVEMCNAGGGINVVSSGGYISKRELYNQIQAMISLHYNINKKFI